MAISGDQTILQYVGSDRDTGGILAVVRTLAAVGSFRTVLGVNPGFEATRSAGLECLEWSRVEGEKINLWNALRAYKVARQVRRWLGEDHTRVFHGHSRAGLLVALWLAALGERRVVATVHCYGRQRWFYRWAARVLGERLFWLTPAMKRYYGVGDGSWAQCIPGCVPAAAVKPRTPAVGGRVRLGGIGMLVRWKRWHLVLEALALLPAEVRARIVFSHIGGPDDSADSRAYAAALREQTRAAKLEENVEWRGEQPSSAGLLETVDCLVVTSHNEPFSIAMLEALRARVPVLAADSGGAVDLIAPPRNGWLFRSGDAASLAEQLSRLVEMDTLADVVLDDGARFHADTVARTYIDVYRRLENPA